MQSVFDQVGSLRLVIDSSGEVQRRIEYDAFGYVTGDTNQALDVPFGFAGGLYDPETRLCRLGYRDYDTETGRWTAKNPIFFAGGDTNLYGYCIGDPANWIDVDGLVKGVHFDRTPGGKRLIHYDKYRYNKDGDLVNHGGKKIENVPKDAKKTLEWLRNVKPDFFKLLPLIIWLPEYDKILKNLENGLPIDYYLYDENGKPCS